ncbi:MAG TPA: RAMP superfamily CRISPR-associated protein [Anaerolineae bacterium]|nr:RAMP superfamily CRISPR-associated protein [Anaerolineae bacterium]
MSLTLTFEIKITSDYHVGAGHGLGTEVDSALLRDADYAPALRGSSLNGLLRDGLWQLLQLAPLSGYRDCQASGLAGDHERYCGQYATDDLNDESHAAQCPICRLFGTPRAMKRWRIGSARPADYEIVALTPYKREDFSDQPVRRVRVDPRTRRAAPNKLFAEEQGSARTFRFTATCVGEDQAALDEAALLVAAARYVRQLGRSRRRGQGECEFTLIEAQGMQGALGNDPQGKLLEHFAARWLHDANAVTLTADALSARPLAVPETGKDHQLRYRMVVRLDEPLIVADRATAGNRFASHAAIPGKALRGAMAHLAAQHLELTDTGSDTYTAFMTLFLRDAVRFPTLYPLLRADKDDPGLYPVIPTPGDGFGCKVYKNHSVQWGTQIGEVEKCPECGNPVKGIRSGFYLLHAKPKVQKPDPVTEMHIRVDPQSNRVQEGQLFDYAALAPGQYFVGEITCASEAAWEQFKTCTGAREGEAFTLWLGKGTRRGYGRATVWLTSVAENTPHINVYHPFDKRVTIGAEQFTLTLLSDTIVRDTWGRYVTGFALEWLEKALGFAVDIVDGRAYSSSHTIDGFNDQWRLPRERALALTAGSTARLQVSGGLTQAEWNKLKELEREGIGERRNEGYGQIVINHAAQGDAPEFKETIQTTPDKTAAEMQSTESRPPKFTDKWNKILTDSAISQPAAWRALAGAPAMALARWLNAQQARDPQWLKDNLGAQGLADDELKDIIRKQGTRAGEDEYGAREQKENRLKNGRELIEALLTQLEAQPAPWWSVGVRMLADRVAEYAGAESSETGGTR